MFACVARVPAGLLECIEEGVTLPAERYISWGVRNGEVSLKMGYIDLVYVQKVDWDEFLEHRPFDRDLVPRAVGVRKAGLRVFDRERKSWGKKL